MALVAKFSYTSCDTPTCPAVSAFTMEMDEQVVTVKTQDSTPLSSINYFKWELIGVAPPTDWVDSYIEFSGASATSVGVGTTMSGLPISVSNTYGVPFFDLATAGISFDTYNVFKLRLTVKTVEGCTSVSEILFDYAGNYYTYTLISENQSVNAVDTADCDCGCGGGCGCSDNDICSCVTLTDETNYGVGGNPARGACEVTFEVSKVDSNLVEYPMTIGDYDPATVTAVNATLDGDGWYKLVMNVTDTGTGFVYSDTQNIMVSCAAWKKYNATVSKLTCGDNDDSVVLALSHLSANLDSLEYLWCKSDYQGAQRVLECINAIDTGCGCGDC